MTLADGIRKHGFRKWYERELLQSHAHLVLTFLCVVGLFAAFEAAWRFPGWLDQLTDLVAAALCGATGLWALRRYLYLLNHAELAANQAECPQCRAYARLTLVRPEAQGNCVDVRCRACGHGWRIDADA
jgi:hypothetical protein